MRLAIVSDIHGNLPALEAVLADLRTRGTDATVNLGDCASSPLWPLETFELLETLAWPTVRGNHDRWIAERPLNAMGATDQFTAAALGEHRCRALGGLPATRKLDGGVLAVHGTPASDVENLL
jgi:predicted phosphodiesterase